MRKEDVCLLQSYNSLLPFEASAFAVEGRLLSMGTLSSKGVCDPRAFAPSNCHCHRRGLCRRRAFAIEEPLPLTSKAIAIEGSLLSMGLWHQMAFAIEGPFAIEGHPVLRALCRRRPFAIEGPFPWKSLFFAFKGPLTLASKDLSLLMRLPLPSKGVCHRWGVCRRRAFVIEEPLASKRPCLCLRSVFNGNATSSDPAVPRLE